MERLQRTRLLSVVVLGAIFGSGVLLGLALDFGLDGADHPPVASDEQASVDSDEAGDRQERVPLYHQVGALTAQQDARIDSIMDLQRESMRELQRDFDDFRGKYNSRMSQIGHRTREAIKEVLSVEQAEMYDSLLADYWRARRGGENPEGKNR